MLPNVKMISLEITVHQKMLLDYFTGDLPGDVQGRAIAINAFVSGRFYPDAHLTMDEVNGLQHILMLQKLLMESIEAALESLPTAKTHMT